jgi:alkanesulfonate monooxygenase SsuD/methylene tetrahydromethanopterin reductase-like flavin-dependent oxidoreductase (luciferase family)/predicted kinase
MAVIPDPALVWLVGPSGSGKTTWATARFRPGEIVSSDSLRESVGSGEHDLEASADAFAALELIASARLARGMTAVIDSLGFDDELRCRLLDLAGRGDIPAVAVVFDTPESQCRARNSSRDRPVPARVLTAQLRRYREVRTALAGEGWEVIVADAADVVEASHTPGSAEARRRQGRGRTALQFFLHVADFEWIAAPELFGESLRRLAAAAEEVGFEGISVMDHVMQIPQVGRAWEKLPEAMTTVSYLAGATEQLRLSTLVTNVTLRPPALLAKMLATLDVLSGGRAECGLGAGWFEDEHVAYGIDFAPAGMRLDTLEDALHLLPLMWGPGSPAFHGKSVQVPKTVCYPRPIQDRIPMIVGGSGDRTLRLAGELADGCNLLSSRIEEKLPVVQAHSSRAGRDPEKFLITVLDVTVCGRDRNELGGIIEQIRGNQSAARVAKRLLAGTIDEQIGRYRLLAELGVDRVYVGLADLSGPETVKRFGPVVAAFRGQAA